MAKVLKNDLSGFSHLRAEQKACSAAQAEVAIARARFGIFAIIIVLMAAAVGFILGATRPTFWAFEAGILALFVWWVALVAPADVRLHRVRSQLRAVEHGLGGEIAVGKVLAEELPDDYYVINDIKIALDEQETQIDHIVVTPWEVLCIETKNWRGKYQSGQTGWLWQPLKGSRAKPRWHKDPQAQSLMHSQALSHYLESASLHLKIQPVVVLADSQAQWLDNGEHKECPVLFLHELTGFVAQRQQGMPCLDAHELAQFILKAHIR